jgi:poly(A) polymerase
MREMLALQPRFATTHGKRAMNLLEHRRFRAAYDFLVLRAEVGDVDADLAQFWTGVQEKSGDERADSFQIKSKPRSQRRRRRRKRRPRADQSS